MEGSLRQAGTKLRIAVQLADTSSGVNLWAETFDRDQQQADVFKLQDEIGDRVVATVADPYDVLTRSMVAAMDAKPPETLTPHRLSCASFFINRESARKITCRRASLSSARSSCNLGTRTPGPRWHSCASMRTGTRSTHSRTRSIARCMLPRAQPGWIQRIGGSAWTSPALLTSARSGDLVISLWGTEQTADSRRH